MSKLSAGHRDPYPCSRLLLICLSRREISRIHIGMIRYLLLTHSLVIGKEASVANDCAIVFIGEIGVKLHMHSVSLRYKLLSSRVIACG